VRKKKTCWYDEKECGLVTRGGKEYRKEAAIYIVHTGLLSRPQKLTSPLVRTINPPLFIRLKKSIIDPIVLCKIDILGIGKFIPIVPLPRGVVSDHGLGTDGSVVGEEGGVGPWG
jgi:hypothetical protein